MASMTKAKCTAACQAMNMPVAILQSLKMPSIMPDYQQASTVLDDVNIY